MLSNRVLFSLISFLLFTPAAVFAQEVVIDNDSGAPGYVEEGIWTLSSSTGYQGGIYRYVQESDVSTASATWTLDLPSSGLYEIYAAFRDGTNRTTGAPVTIKDASGISVIILDQSGTGHVVERLLGEFYFEKGTDASVRMDNNGEVGYYISDAMIWRPVLDPAPVVSKITRDPQYPDENNDILVTAQILDNTRVESAVLIYTVYPSGTSETVLAFDDGLHGDGLAGDHIYGATIASQPDGSLVGFNFTAWDNLQRSGSGPVNYFNVGALPLYLPDVLVDNDGGPPGYVETGSWTTSPSVGYNGGTYRYVNATSGDSTASATWTADIPQTDVYRVYAAFLQGQKRTPAIPLTITHCKGQALVQLNQKGPSALVKVLLGEYPFEAGTKGLVRMDNNGELGSCIADAMIWELVSDPRPEISLVTRNPVNPIESDSVLVTAVITDNHKITSATLSYQVSPTGVSQYEVAYDDGTHGDGEAGDGQFGATVPPQEHGATVSYNYSASDSAGQTVRSATGYYVVGEPAHNVYVVLSSDTSVWGNLKPGTDLDWEVFTSQAGVLSKTFDSSFRYRHADSLGNPFKMAWFMMGGAWFMTATNSTASSATYYIKKYWGDDIEFWGDSLDYHFHHYVYTDEWKMAPTFEEKIPEYEWTMSAMMLDENLFITAFRSGWNYMDNIYQQYLERWVPFRMEGVQSDWTPYHPSDSNWRAPGSMKGWEVRHKYTKNFSSQHANNAFSNALSGTDQVLCIWSHQNEKDFPEQITAVHQILQDTASAYPGVQFHYCSATEAMQRWLGETSPSVPPLQVASDIQDSTVSVKIETSDDIYQEQPWVAARNYDDEYLRLNCTKNQPGQWQFSYSTDEYDRVSVGVSDIYGNVVMEEIFDGSRRWSNQSEFSEGVASQVDLDATAVSVRLKQNSGSYLTSGSLTIDHSIENGAIWKSIQISGTTPEETGILCRYKTARTRQELESALWSTYSDQTQVTIEAQDAEKPWLRFQLLLEGTDILTPELDSVEIHYIPLPIEKQQAIWSVY